MKEIVNWPARFNQLWCMLIIGITIFGGGCALSLGDSSNFIYFLIAMTGALALWIATRMMPRSDYWLGLIQFISACLMFPLFKAIQISVPRSTDINLLHFERWLFHDKSLSERLLSEPSYWLSELMSLSYFSFFLIVLLPIIYFGCKSNSPARNTFFHGLMLIYFFSFLGYLLIPAAGPYSVLPDLFVLPDNVGIATHFMSLSAKKLSTGIGAFPGLRVGLTLYILGYFILMRRFVITLILFPLVAGILMSSLYFGHNYAISILAAGILALSVIVYLHKTRSNFYV